MEEINYAGILEVGTDGYIIVADDAVYTPRILKYNLISGKVKENMNLEMDVYGCDEIPDDYSIAYLIQTVIPSDPYGGLMPFFYPYRGKVKKLPKDPIPGVYVTEDKIKIIQVIDPDDMDKYSIERLTTIDTQKMIDTLKKPDSINYQYATSNKHFVPDVSNSDDILKRGLKLAFKEKRIDIDNCKDNFSDRNALFNFKSVMKGDGRLSILLFDRGCEALGLEYYIVLREKDPEHPIGTSLESPEALDNIGAEITRFSQNIRTDSLPLKGSIIVGTTDTYDI